LIKLCPPMQSPKSPVYKAGYRFTRSSVVTPSALVPDMVSVAELPELDVVDVAVLCAWTQGIIVVRSAREETTAVVHDAEDKGKRAIVEMVELVYVERRRRNRATPSGIIWMLQPAREVRNTSSCWVKGW